MAKTREQKEVEVQRLKDRIDRAKGVVFVNYKGLKVKEIEDLRGKLRSKAVDFNVAKNTLAKKVIAEQGIETPAEVFDKPVAIAFAYEDEAVSAKEIAEFAKTNEAVEILGGVFEKQFIDVATVRRLAALPSKEELYAKVVGSISSPLNGMVNVLAGNMRGLINVLNGYKEKIS